MGPPESPWHKNVTYTLSSKRHLEWAAYLTRVFAPAQKAGTDHVAGDVDAINSIETATLSVSYNWNSHFLKGLRKR